MIVYAETSAVLRWLFNEPGGAQILDQLRDAEKIVCSRLTLIEIRRAIHKALLATRIREVDAADMRATLSQAGARWALLEISPEVAMRAEQRFPAEPVRTLDALHLASALFLRESLAALALLSTDARVRENARLLGFDVVPDRA